MPSEPFWLTANEVAEYARLAVEMTGEPFFIRDANMLEGAIASPRNRWHYGETRIPVLCATLLLAIAQDHPFEQGNKRAALGAASGFSQLNGHRLAAEDDAYADLILAVIDRSITRAIFVDRFTGTVHPVRRPRVFRLRNSGFQTRRLRPQ